MARAGWLSVAALLLLASAGFFWSLVAGERPRDSGGETASASRPELPRDAAGSPGGSPDRIVPAAGLPASEPDQQVGVAAGTRAAVTALLPTTPRGWDLEVEVRDARGLAAAAVPLELGWPGTSTGEDARAETDAGGRALFRDVPGRFPGQPGRKLRVRVALALAEELAQELWPERPLAGPVRFVLPPLGAVEVLVQEPGGAAAEDGTLVELGLVRPGEPRDISPFSGERRERREAATRDGGVLFAHVELGNELELTARRAGGNVRTREYLPGPRFPGERPRYTLLLGLDHPVLVFRAVDARGEPLRRRELLLELSTRSGWMIGNDERKTQSDQEGCFLVELAADYRDGDRRSLTVSTEGEALGARVDLGRAFAAGRNELGDLVLAPPPLIAAGRVLAGRERPVAAFVRLEVPVHEDERRETIWYWDEVASAQADADGRFALHGHVDGEQARLTAELEGLRSAPQTVAVGSQALEIWLLETGWVEGSVLLDPGVPPEKIQALLRRVEGGQPGADALVSETRGQTALGEDGRFRIGDQFPGLYELELQLGDERPLLTIPGIELRAGQGSPDPRLDPIDLRGRLFAVRIRLVPPRPDPELRGNLAYRPAGDAGTGEESEYFYDADEIRLVTTHPRLDARLFVQGYRAERLSELSGEREVRLRPALAVRLALPAGIVLPTPPVHLKAVLVATSGEQQIDWGASAFDERREVRCHASEPGRMKVAWIYERRAENGASATLLALEPEQFVEVLDIEAEQRFELELSNEALARALESLPF
jgi:hypothetical protein